MKFSPTQYKIRKHLSKKILSFSTFQWCQQSIKNITEDQSNSHLSYVRSEEICSCFEGDTLLAVKAPSGTQLEVPKPESVIGGTGKRYQIHLKSNEGQIYVVLVNRDAETEQPMVVQVPPPEEVMKEAMGKEANNKRAAACKRKAGSPPESGAAAKKYKTDPEELDEVGLDKKASKEVESIMSGGTLDTHFPGLEEFMSANESKIHICKGS